MWPASVCGQPAWLAATQPGPRRPARTAGVTQPGGLGRPNQAGSPSPSVLPGPGNPGRPGWPAPPNQGGRTAQPVCLGHPASTRQPYGRLAGHPGPPGQPGRRCCRSPPAASRGSLPWPLTARGAARGALAKVAALARARGHRPRSAASTAWSTCARPCALMLGERHLPSGRAAAIIGRPDAARVLRRYAKEVRANTGLLHDDAATTRAWTPRETDVLTCAVIMSCGVWVNSVKSMLGKLSIHLEKSSTGANQSYTHKTLAAHRRSPGLVVW